VASAANMMRPLKLSWYSEGSETCEISPKTNKNVPHHCFAKQEDQQETKNSQAG